MEPAGSPPVGDSALLEALAQTRLAECYQCGKCTAGCPVAGHMDAPPNLLIRYLQLGLVEKALGAVSVWRCVGCQICSARCPKGVDCAAVLDALRELALARGLDAAGAMRIVAFQRAFLENIRRNGRLDEVELTARFKQKAFLRDRNFALLVKDAGLAPALMKRGKFHLRGKRVRDRALVDRIFARLQETLPPLPSVAAR